MSRILGNLSKILALDVSFAENSFPQTLQTKLVFIFVKFGVICSCLGDWLSCTGCFIIGSIWFRNHGKSFTKWDPKRCSCSSFILAKKTQCARDVGALRYACCSAAAVPVYICKTYFVLLSHLACMA